MANIDTKQEILAFVVQNSYIVCQQCGGRLLKNAAREACGSGGDSVLERSLDAAPGLARPCHSAKRTHGGVPTLQSQGSPTRWQLDGQQSAEDALW